MKRHILLGAFALIAFAFASNISISSAEKFIEPAATTNASALAHEATAPAPRFSSRYTSLTGRGCGSGMTKKEEREAEKQGSDIPTRCKGPGGYDINIYYSACTSEIQAVKGDNSIPLASQAVNWKQKIVEWRMAQTSANAAPVPFAVIIRVYEYAGDDLCATNGKVTREFLIVKGLGGFEHVDEKIEVKKNPNANLQARQLADKKYTVAP